MLYILNPIPLASDFTLDEALHWVAYRQYAIAHPIADYLFNDEEKFDDVDEMFGRKTDWDKTDKTGTKGLFFQDNNYEKRELQKRGLTYPNQPTFVGEFDERYLQSKQYMEEIDHIKNVCLDPYKNELLLKLQEGKINAIGKLRGTLKKGISESKWKNNSSWQKIEYEREDLEEDIKKSILSGKPVSWVQKIPPEFWYSEGINWQENSARSRMGWFHLIFISTKQLMSVFPPPEGKPIVIEEKAGYLIYDDEKKNMESIQQIESHRGRPQLNWPEFHAEVLCYCLFKGEIPKLQKDIEHHMETWCKKQWGRSPSHGAMNEQISPLYKRLKEVKKSGT